LGNIIFENGKISLVTLSYFRQF